MNKKMDKPQGGMFALWKDHGRVWVESIHTLEGIAIVRFDCNDGTRSRVSKAPIAQIDFTREWRI